MESADQVERWVVLAVCGVEWGSSYKADLCNVKAMVSSCGQFLALIFAHKMFSSHCFALFLTSVTSCLGKPGWGAELINKWCFPQCIIPLAYMLK